MKFISDLKLKYYNQKLNSAIQKELNTIRENYRNEYVGIKISQDYDVNSPINSKIVNLAQIAGTSTGEYFKLEDNELVCQKTCWCIVLSRLVIKTSSSSQIIFNLSANNAVIDSSELSSDTIGYHQLSDFTVRMFNPGEKLKMTVTADGNCTIKARTQLFIIMLARNAY